MSTVQRIAKNTAVMATAQIVSYVVNFFSAMFTARYLGVENYGVLSFALAFAGIFAVFTDLGVSTLATREIARNKSLTTKYLVNLSLIKVISVAAVFGVIALTINLMSYPHQTVAVVYVASLSVVIGAFTQVFYAIFLAHERMQYQAFGLFLYSVAVLLAVMLAIRFELALVDFAILYSAAGAALALFYCLAVYRLKFHQPQPGAVAAKAGVDWSFSKSLVRAALPLLAASVFIMIAYRIDMVMLSLMKGDAAVGLYSAAYKLIDALGFIPMAFSTALFPVLSQLHVSAQDSLKFAYQKAFKYLLIVGLPIAVGTTLVADRIIVGIYSINFSEATSVLRILIWAGALNFLNWLLWTMLTSINKQHVITRVTFLSMSFNIIANLILIPKYSYNGAAIATTMTYGAACGLYLHFVSKFVCKVESHKLITKPAIASAAVAASLIVLQRLSLFLLVPIAGMIYFVVLILLRDLTSEDLRLLKQVRRMREPR